VGAVTPAAQRSHHIWYPLTTLATLRLRAVRRARTRLRRAPQAYNDARRNVIVSILLAASAEAPPEVRGRVQAYRLVHK
jgi:hypothetical protein